MRACIASLPRRRRGATHGGATRRRPHFRLRIPVREHSHARPTRYRPDRAMELDPPDRHGLGLGGPVLDRRLAGRREVLVALLPGDGARRGRVGHDGLALHHSVPFRSRTVSGRAAHVLVGRGPHGVVLLVRPGALPPGIRRMDLGSAPAWRRAILAHGEEPGYVALRDARFELAPAGRAVDRVPAAAVLVRHRGHDLHLHAASDDERAALGLDGLPGERAGPRRAPVVLPVHHHRGQLRLHPGAERGDPDSCHRADRVDGAGRAGGRPVRGALLVPRADRCHHAVAGPAGVPAGYRRDAGAGPPGVGGCAWHDVVLVRPVRHAGAARHPRAEGDGRRGRRAGGRNRGRGVLARSDQRAQGGARVVQEGGPAPDGAADLAGAAARRERDQLPVRRDHGQAALQSAVPVAGPGAPQHADLRDRQDPHGRGRCGMRRRVAALVLGLSATACAPSQKAEAPRSTLVIGLDISGSFRRNPSFNGALEFASLYIYGHLNGIGGLQPNTAIFVGELGGERTGQAKVFHPIQDLSGKSPAQIAADLRTWFPQEDPITDFNAFFQRAALHVKRNNLVLAPLNVVLFSDGEPDYPGAGRLSLEDKYKRVDLSPLEYLSRNVTVRLLYADPPIAQLWENKVPRKRVRLWTQDSEVMKGWRRHMVDGAPMQRQDSLWSRVDKVVDVRVRRERVL